MNLALFFVFLKRLPGYTPRTPQLVLAPVQHCSCVRDASNLKPEGPKIDTEQYSTIDKKCMQKESKRDQI